MFTQREAVTLLEDHWGVQNVEKRLKDDRHSLLDDIVTSVQAKVPFQNLSLMAVPTSERKRPTRCEIKRDCISGLGGICYTVNNFTFNLLKALTYDVALCNATCTAKIKTENNHIFVLVRNLDRPGDSFLVETGLGFPTFKAINLDFDKESPVFEDSFLEYQYIKYDNLLLRMHRKGDTAPRPNPPRPEVDFYQGEWRRFYYSDLKPVTNVEEFDKYFDEIYTNTAATSFHKFPRVTWFPHKRACILSAGRLTLEQDGGEMVVQTYDDDDDSVLHHHRQHFPQISAEVVLGAYREWRRLRHLV